MVWTIWRGAAVHDPTRRYRARLVCGREPCGFFRNTLRTLDRIELLPATHLPEENVQVLNQSGEVVIAFVHVHLVNRRPGSLS